MRKGKRKRKSAWLGFVFATGRVWLPGFRGGGAGVEPGRPVQKYFVSSVAYAQPLGHRGARLAVVGEGNCSPLLQLWKPSQPWCFEDSKV